MMTGSCEGAGSICPLLILTEPAVTKTTPIVAIFRILMVVSNKTGRNNAPSGACFARGRNVYFLVH